jgi:hypothetical protein
VISSSFKFFILSPLGDKFDWFTMKVLETKFNRKISIFKDKSYKLNFILVFSEVFVLHTYECREMSQSSMQIFAPIVGLSCPDIYSKFIKNLFS